jgi:hypothetical protein
MHLWHNKKPRKKFARAQARLADANKHGIDTVHSHYTPARK